MTKDSNALAERMKAFEQAAEGRLDRTKPFLMRLDGHCFSKFTKQFRKPYDVRIHNAMVLATADLVTYFGCATGFTQSDEITLVFPAPVTAKDLEEEVAHPGKAPKAMQFNGRIQKITSLAAGYCSIRFNHHLQNQPILDTDSDILKQKMGGMVGFFDARVFNVQNDNDLLNNLIWRSRYDCERNSTAMLAQAHFGAKELHGLSRKQQREKLINEKQIDWEQEPNWFKYGALVKKELYEKTATNPKTGEIVQAMRARVVSKAFQLSEFSETLVQVLISKYWDQTFDSYIAENSSLIVQASVLSE